MKSDAVTLRAIACPLLLAVGAGAILTASVVAKPVKSSKTSKTKSAAKVRPARAPQTKRANRPLPRFLPLAQLKDLQAARANLGWYSVDTYMDGKPLMAKTLPGAAPVPDGPALRDLPRLKAKTVKVRANAQRFPRPIAPAPVRGAATRPAVPRWVRYPLEFQLAGIGIGTRAVDKDRFNRIDRYGLFAMHGNPTAVVVSGQVATGGAGGGSGGGESGGRGSSGGPGGSSGSGGEGGGGPAAPAAAQNITVQQQPPEVSALFPAGVDGAIPDWAAAITVQLDNNHVQWLYKRDTYAMGFVVDRLGFVDAIVVAGFASPIARTQLEDPVHTIKLGDDLRKVLFRYGYPDTIETYTVAVAGVGVGGPAQGGGEGGSGGGSGGEGGSSGRPPGSSGGPGGSSGGPGGEGETGGGATAAAGNNAYRTFEVRYEQSYNVVFTIRNNRVVRIYIFGDPDFFNDRRRQQFRIAY